MSCYFEVAASALQALRTIEDESVRPSPVCVLKSCSDPSGQNIFLLMLCCLQREDQCNKSMREHTLAVLCWHYLSAVFWAFFPRVSVEFCISTSVIIATLSILFFNRGRQLLCGSSMRPVCLVCLHPPSFFDVLSLLWRKSWFRSEMMSDSVFTLHALTFIQCHIIFLSGRYHSQYLGWWGLLPRA